ncbi:MFS transporter [Streptomyces sp. Li-HN-5-11]|uniref:MFS transporter n=1 Tax=Streptomyces sp. Li-HN-5-11 TaxID=3075432 RepID=UPI0028A903E2|nr:MFS transporter [Streptomyces sp. Li-HN-5-11]WNM29982.1 MFS transporter [Streptomyces sp. Li-HN-5-11]
MPAMARPEGTTPTAPRSRRSLRKATVGNVLEWYDWNVYAIFAPFFAPELFDAHDTGGALLQSLMVFAVGFLTRPVGGLLLGRWGDRHGRRAALTLSMVLMASGSLLIAVCPTHAAIGWPAPLLVLVARLAQGLSAGGEFGASSAYVVEIAPAGRKGLYSSVIYVSNAVGNLLAALLGVILTASLTTEQMHTWGWRVPFLLGAGLAGYAYVLRRSMDESHRPGRPEAERDRVARRPAALLRIIGYTLAGTVVYYTWVVFLPSYASADGHVPEDSALVATTVAQLLFVVALPLAGALADRVGARRLLLGFSGAFALLTVPLLALAPRSFAWLVLVQCVGMVIFSGYGATAPLVMAEQFPAHLRATGIGLPYGLTVSVFGGTAPYLAAAADHTGNAVAYSGYVAVVSVISFAFFAGLRPSSNAWALGAPGDHLVKSG